MSVRAAFRAIDTDDSGYIDKSELGKLLQSLSDSSITQNDVLFALNEVGAGADGKVSFSEFKKWYLRTRKGHRGSKYNKLLVKDLVGRSRTSSYDLPSKQFTFGYVIPRDVNDAKEVITNWQSGKERVSGSEILKARNTRGAPSRKTVYGHVNRPSTPMGKLIKGEFAGAAVAEKEYPAKPTHAKVTRKAEQAQRERAAVTEAAARGRLLRATGGRVAGTMASSSSSAGWKMKKFSKVKSRVYG